ncbi:MAG: choice-of-anchor D domain-containing protein [Candidatus Sumerlaeia bacterium]|nr:choice-of-anchor D domain-containing protein [Candidatus Sumerlaeia bacterium]
MPKLSYFHALVAWVSCMVTAIPGFISAQDVVGRTAPGSTNYSVQPMERIVNMGMASGERYANFVLVDPSTGHHYYGLNLFSNAGLLKIQPNAGHATQTRIGMLLLNQNAEVDTLTGVLDPDRGRAYISTTTSSGAASPPGRLVTVSLNQPNQTPTRLHTHIMDSPFRDLTSSAVDLENQYAYFGGRATSTGDYHIHKFDISGETPALVASMPVSVMGQFSEIKYNVTSLIFNPYDGLLYVGTSSSNRLLVVDPGEGDAMPSILFNQTTATDRYGRFLLDHDGTVLYAIPNQTLSGTQTFAKYLLDGSESAPVRVGTADFASSWVYEMAHDKIANRILVSTQVGVASVDPGKLPTDPPLLVGEADLRAAGENRFMTMTVDEEYGVAIVSADRGSSTAGSILKVALHSGLEPPVQVAAGRGLPSTSAIRGGVLDEENGILYTANINSITSFDVTGESQPPLLSLTEIDGVAQNAGGIVGDPSSGYLFIADTHNSGSGPPRIHKYKIPENSRDPLIHLGSVGVDGINYQNIRILKYDPVQNAIYFATQNPSFVLAKIYGGDGEDPPSLVEVTSLGYTIESMEISADGLYGLVGHNSNPGRIQKVSLGEGTDEMTIMGEYVSSQGGTRRFEYSVADPENDRAWFRRSSSLHVVQLEFGGSSHDPILVDDTNVTGTWWDGMVFHPEYSQFFAAPDSERTIRRVDLVTTDTVQSEVYTLPEENLTNDNPTLLLDRTRDVVYRATTAQGIAFERIQLNGASGPMEADYTERNVYNFPDNNLSSPILDKERGYLLYAGNSKVAKFRERPGDELPAKVSELSGHAYAGVAYDQESGYAYYYTSPNFQGTAVIVSKVHIGEGDNPPVLVGEISLHVDDFRPQKLVLDTQNGYGYLLCDPTHVSERRIVKIDLGDDGEPPTRVGHFNTGGFNTNAFDMVMTNDGLLVVVYNMNPVRLVKYSISGSLPSQVSSYTFPSGTTNFRDIVMHPTSNQAYLVFNASQNTLVEKINLGNGFAAPSRVGGRTITGRYAWRAAIDEVRNHLYLHRAPSMDTMSQYIVLSIGGGSTLPEFVANRTANLGVDINFSSMLVDSEGGYLYFTQNDTPAHLSKISLGQRDMIKGSRVNFTAEASEISGLNIYSHKAVGDLRLAIYTADDPPQLVWQSEITSNTAANDWLHFPISAGTPSTLQLQPGSYFACWMTNTNDRVMSYVRSDRTAGIAVRHAFGEFPEGMGTETRPTRERWSINVEYTEIHPEMDVPTTPLDFGSRDLADGATDPDHVTVSNTGQLPVVINAVNITGDHVGDFLTSTTVPLEIPVGQSADIDVSFHPSAVGVRTATLVIEGNDPENSMVMIDLTGTGITENQPEPHRFIAEDPNAPGETIEFIAPEGTTLVDVEIVTESIPAGLGDNITFPFGLFSFEIHGVPVGGSATVTIELPREEPLSDYYRFGPLAANPTPHWYSFGHDGTTGAEIDGTTITLHFVDGGRGDDDLTANGVIVDPGGPVIIESSTMDWMDLMD